MFTEERQNKIERERWSDISSCRAGDVRALRTSNAFWQTRVLSTFIYIYIHALHTTEVEIRRRCIIRISYSGSLRVWTKRKTGLGIFDKWHRPYWYGQGLFQGQVRNGFFRIQHTYGLESPFRLYTNIYISAYTTHEHTYTNKRKYGHFFLFFSSLLTATSTRFVRTSIVVFSYNNARFY